MNRRYDDGNIHLAATMCCCFSKQFNHGEVGAVVILVLQLWKLRHGTIKSLPRLPASGRKKEGYGQGKGT